MVKIKKSALWVFEQLFDKNNINLKNKVLLDIGGGSAGFGFYYSSILSEYYCVDAYQGNGNPKLNVDGVLWSDKFYPNFWLKVVEENNTYHKINCHYQVPFKLKLFFPIIRFSNILRIISAYISSSSYIIKAYKK